MIKKNNIITSFSLIVGFIMILSSCTYNNEEELYPEITIVDDISYITDIQPIIEVNCYACHQVGATCGDINLEGYENIVIRVEDGSLLGTINHDPDWSAMPQGASKLSDSQINKISLWVEQGYANN